MFLVDSERELLTKIVCGFGSAPCNHPDKVRKTFYSLKRKGLIEPLVLKGVVRKGYVATDQGTLLCRKELTK
jgi:hypothetical protein